MSATPPVWRPAWEPFTPRGVAAFAGGSFARLFVAQILSALLLAATVVWFLRAAWFPVVRDAIQQLPRHAEINKGLLEWNDDPSVQLAENRFLGVAVDLYHSGGLGRAAHLQLEFGGENLRIYSLLGFQSIEYPMEMTLPFNRPDLEPWWGAWQPWIEVGAGAAVALAMLVFWQVFAMLYFLPVRVLGYLADRDLNFHRSWQLAGAAQLPGAFFLAAGIVAYGMDGLDLIQLLAVICLQFVIGWIYLLVSPFLCPRTPAAAKSKSNPFAAPPEPAPKSRNPKGV